ncbi:protein tyrosine phosphatase [Pedobacter psychroterrae]|uniref:Protein tyrosine phosphatase n=1 Tax=Pedobacter psychroterrae TaxID=2530453 RepID=A0A4R0NKB1_9SPHI|nr:protein tyrosine phosphatase [Pedobacter psychroterrae]
MNILFICSRNKWRSLTAEHLFKESTLHNVRSAGTAASARIKVSEKLIEWADLIFVMEKRHRDQLRERSPILISNKDLVVLNIPDEYQYMDEELIEIIISSVAPYISFE